jgi:tetratricopeptide (TPR) repeat protein
MNFFRSFVPKCLLAAFFAAGAGCGSGDDCGDFNAGCAAHAARDFQKAAQIFEKCVEREPGNVSALVYLSSSKLELNDLKGAAETLSKAAAIAGGDIDVRMLDAQIAMKMKDYDRSAGIYTDIAENGAHEPAIRSQAYSGLGVVESFRDNRDLARIAFMKAIRINNRNAAAWYNLALLYRDQFSYLKASLDHFDMFVGLEQATDARVQRAQNSMMPELKASLARSVSERPGVDRRNSAVSAAAISKAESAMKAKTYKTARLRYAEALQADPLSYPAAVGLAKAWLASDKTRNGKLKAHANYKLACKLRPSSVSTFLSTGELASSLGMYASAVDSYSRALAANPASLDAIDGLIRALRKVDKRKTAQAYQVYRDMVHSSRKKD